MTYDKFLYYVRMSSFGFQVEIGYFDPERFEGQGGHLFACTAELDLNDRSYGYGDPDYEIKVRQQGNSLVSIEDAEMRAEVNRQVLEMAYFVRHQLDAGETPESISKFLKDALRAGEPVDNPFRYSGSKQAVFGNRGVGS